MAVVKNELAPYYRMIYMASFGKVARKTVLREARKIGGKSYEKEVTRQLSQLRLRVN